MKKIPSKKYSEEEMQEMLQSLSETVQPSEELLRATLAKLAEDTAPILSPIQKRQLVPSFFTSRISPFVKIGVPVFVVALLLLGTATVLTDTTSSTTSSVASAPLAMSNPNDTSDAALNQDTEVIDTEMSALNSDESATDQALNYSPSE
jgi:Sec-independent protein translocase protein TatA